MDREKILEKSKAEMKEEEISIAKNLGQDIGYKVILIICIAFVTFDFFRGVVSYQVNTLLFGLMGSQQFANYKVYGKKRYLLFSILFLVLTIFYLIKYIIDLA